MPTISIIVPCYNEEKTIHLLLQSIYDQTWVKSDLEVVIADGQSSDGTRQKIQEFQTAHPDLAIRLVVNPRRNIPAALNCAIAASAGGTIVRLDGHSQPAPDYVERCMADLNAGCGEMVGGVWRILPGGKGWIPLSIAQAAAHPFGVGDALYRYATQPAFVDTVPFGAFRRELLEKVGAYDESLLTNEDYEFNTRIRQSGGRIWLDPAIHSVYFARSNLLALAKQYGRYGFWKFKMLQRYPRTLRWRQALPPVFVFSLIFLAVLAFFWNLAAWLLLLDVLFYLVFLVFGAISPARRAVDFRLIAGIPLAIATMHLAWGAGFLGSVVKSVFGISRTKPEA
jgi:succinoglycan biosynthesis protein ExoA